MHKWKCIAVSLIFLLCFLAAQIQAFAEFDISIDTALLMEASTGRLLFEKNVDTPVPPASITKLMTLYLAFEALESGKASWDDRVSVSEKAWKMEGSRMFLEVGHETTFGELVTGISVVSANDACVAVAEHLYGSEDAFVKVMNQRAQELGLTNSSFRNSTGLPENGHRMSARDIAVLARILIDRYPQILKLEVQREFTFNKIHQFNRNPLLGVFPGADGLKTGWTEEAGYCLVGTAVQDGLRLISVVLNTKSEAERLEISQELLNYGFKNFEKFTVLNSGDMLGEADVINGKKLSLPVAAKDSISIIVPSVRKKDLEIVPGIDGSLKAPVEKGVHAGIVEVRLDGEVLGRTELVTADSTESIGFFGRLFRWISAFFKSLFK